ncbi:MAG: hypothetical protein LQ345_002096 [Seirophora villosa]|nr:MAG: hypothetical protein LQ345_002096 [Seirophora villosa]
MEVAVPASIITLVQITEEVVKLCGNYIQGVRHAQRDIERLQSKAQALHGALTKLNNNPQANIDSEAVQKCCEDLKSIEKRLQPRRRHVAMQRIRLRDLEWPFTSQEIEDHVHALKEYMDLFNTSLHLDVLDKTSDAEQDRLLDKLAYAGDALFNSYENEQRHRMCLENTRVEVLQEAMKWAADDSSRCIFWLKGLAGTGKSTIANTVAFRLKAGTRPVATFFFKRGHGDLAHVRKLIPTIARQLSIASPLYRQAIVTVIKKEPDLGSSANFREQYEKLLVEPLRGLLHPTHDRVQFYVIMDALDECEEERDLRMLLNLMAKTDDLPQLGLKILVTSRPELSIRHGFDEIPSIFHRNLALQDVPRSVVDRDIRTYLSHELKNVQRDFNLPADWPVKQDLDTLASKAGGLFIFAATACRYVGGSPQARPDSRLKQICETVAPNKLMTEELDQMYTIILQNSSKGRYTPEERKDAQERFRHIVGSIVSLLSPLPMFQLFNLLKGPQIQSQAELEGTLRTLHAVIHVPNDSNAPVQPLHLSFRDFLFDPNRCFDRHFWVEERDVHRDLVADCLRLLSSSLSRNICSLPSPGTLKSEVDPAHVEAALSPAIQYACRHWAEHARKGEMVVDDHGIIHEFLQTHLLDWLKCMSLMGMITEAISSLLKIVDLTNVSENIPIPSRVLLTATSQLQEAPLAHDFIEDCHRFTLAFRRPIEQAPEQVYVSALVFSPSKSIVRQNFSHEIPRWIRSAMTLPEDWGRSLQTIHCGYRTTEIRFLHHGELLATIGLRGKLDIWDPRTGDCQSSSLPPGDMKTKSLSPDGSLVLSVSEGKYLTIWDVAKLCFSPDGNFLASGSQDRTVRVWKMSSMSSGDGSANSRSEPASEEFDERVGIDTVRFSPDGEFVASQSKYGNTIHIWQAETGECSSQYEGHSPSFSSNGHIVISASKDGLRLFDVETKKSHCSPTSYRAYNPILSPDGRLAASALWEDHSIQIWDIQEDTIISIPATDSGSIELLTFSPTSDLIASISDKKAHIWDARTGESTSVHSQELYTAFGLSALAFSPNSELLAVGCTDEHCLQLWDIRAGSCRINLGPKNVGRMYAFNPTFSPEGPMVAAAFHRPDEFVRLWNTETGDLLLTIPYFSFRPRVEFLAGMNVLFIDGIGHEIDHPSESQAPAIAVRSHLLSDLQVDSSGEWVTRSSKRVLWLPPEWAPKYGSYAVWRNKIAIGSRTGLMTFLTFDDEPNFPGIEELGLDE